LTKRTSYSSSSIFVGSIGEVTMLTIATHIVVDVGKLGPSWGSLGHETPTQLRLCDLGRLLLVGVSLMPPTIVNLLSSIGPDPLLEASPVCLNSVSNFSSVV
jgi:hypothetical protein